MEAVSNVSLNGEIRLYLMGFFAKSLDGRIDDPKAGWKGRGL
jgi:hypothetical protein